MQTKLVRLIKSQSIKVQEDTQFVVVSEPTSEIVLTPQKARETATTFELIFEKEGVTAEIIFLYQLHAKENINVATIANHRVPNTSCETIVRGVLGDKARSNYIGKIIIDKKAQKTSSFLNDKVLVTGDHVANVSEPLLQIEADDVMASHGAVTGRVDEEQIYYLMSRGFSRKESEELVIEGFFASVINRLNNENIKAEVYSLLRRSA